MMRLADYLLRWTGDVTYADYWERNLTTASWPSSPTRHDLIHPEPGGMIAYFLPLHAGGVKPGARPPTTSGAATARWCRRTPAHAYGMYYVEMTTGSCSPSTSRPS